MEGIIMANKPGAGRPREASDETLEKILADIKEGVPHRIACLANGVNYKTFQMWLKTAEDCIGVKDDWKVKFLGALHKSNAIDIKKSLKKVRNSKSSHKGEEFHLRTKYWKYFTEQAPLREMSEDLEGMQSAKDKDIKDEDQEAAGYISKESQKTS